MLSKRSTLNMRCILHLVPIIAFGLIIALPVNAARYEGQVVTTRECVILLHGLGRTSYSMSRLAGGLEDAGFLPVNLNYASRENTIEALALETVPRGLNRCEHSGAHTVHFVTHSMGGILVRYFLGRHRPLNLGRVVMLSPPNRGSEAADHLQDSTLYRWYNGPAGQQLVTGHEGLPGQLGPVDFPLGVITGNKHSFFDYWLADLIPGADDGKVSVERAKVDGMTDFLVLPYSHPFIMDAKEVIEQTLNFLRQGRFLLLPPEAARSPE